MAEYIERDALLDFLQIIPIDLGYREVQEIEDYIKSMPTPAYVRPVIDGNWIPVTNGRGGHECSRCHQYAPSYQSGSEYLSRFCPACGCYMGEG